MDISKRLDLHLAALAAAGAGVGVVADQAEAAIQYSGIVNHAVPATFAGLYLNMVTGAIGGSAGATVGWDIDPWVSGGIWNYFTNSNGANPDGGVVGVGTLASDLAPGTLIGPASTFLTGAGPDAPLGAAVLTGVRLFKEDTATVHYGWVRLAPVTNPATPMMIVDYAWEDVANGGILAGAVPSPGTASLLAVGAAGLLGRRRK